ncbi:DUF4880 domain-containing protein [Chitiniphilus purpureus]|uniref:DUF4880 domain-containing protein n=1 Tax=Chitiniphilus purpureus TaxID=2981137 RepID=A0ABY6DMF1_9NEIS|nr:DUF4880 domain-containing protein [Chitiniphilus sp. CD1]UXY15526.1 DUF4880 domain-containing protein [Chitiniphilus sp. CD1]
MQSDQAWDDAWNWVMRQHEGEGRSEAAQAAFAQWLDADPGHRKAYADAVRLWSLSGLVPPAHDLDAATCLPPGESAAD